MTIIATRKDGTEAWINLRADLSAERVERTRAAIEQKPWFTAARVYNGSNA